MTPQEAWRVRRARQGATKFAPAVDTSVIDDDDILAILVAAEIEYGRHDPADLASVIDWPRLRRRDETIHEYRFRVGL